MAKKSAAKKAAKKTVRRVPASTRAASAGANPPAAETSMFQVLEPFKFHGAAVKPGEWVEMSDDEAREYQDAGVLGTEPGEVPDADETNTTTDASEAEKAD